jgi:rod shape-determining protein MreD
MRSAAFIALGLFLAVAESLLTHLFPLEDLTPDLVLPLIVYTGLLGFNAARGAAIAFLVGYFVDALQPGSPICLHMFVMVSIFLVSRMLAARLLLAGTVFHVLLAFLGSIASSLIIVSLRGIFEKEIGGLQPLIIAISTRAAATAVAAPMVFALARKLDHRRAQRREERLVRYS